jgi:hypothetical protein
MWYLRPFTGLYSRKHLDTLVELVHETLKTLDTAAAKYGNPSADKKKKKKDKVRKSRFVFMVFDHTTFVNMTLHYSNIIAYVSISSSAGEEGDGS